MIVFQVKRQAQTRRTESNCHLTQFKIRSFLQVTQEAIFALDGPMSALHIGANLIPDSVFKPMSKKPK